MSRKRVLFGVCLPVLAAVGLAWVLFLARTSRSVTFSDLTKAQTQTVSVAFLPHKVKWKVSGKVDGTGVVMLAHVYSNRVTGKFSVNGGGDYYDTNASVVFIPEGKATGKIRASFQFNNWY